VQFPPARHSDIVKRASAWTLALFSLCFVPGLVNAANYQIDLEAPAEIRDVLKEFLDLYRYREREDFGRDQLDFLIETTPAEVERLLATEGYFSPVTKVTSQEADHTPTVNLTVNPGPRTFVRDVDINVSGAASQQQTTQVDRISKDWPLKNGTPFRQEDWQAAKQSGVQILQERRYAAARLVESQARILADQTAAELAVHYDSGPAFTFGPLKVEGTKRYPETIVRNVNPLGLGEEYTTNRLLELQRQIQKTPYFSNVIVDLEKDPLQAVQAPVNVRVTEFPTQHVRSNFGYTTDTGFQIEGKYTHLNVFDRAWVFNSQARLEQRRQLGSVELAMPPEPGAWVHSVQGSLERTTLEGVDLRSRRIGVRRARSLDKTDTAYFITYFNDQLEQTDNAPLPPDVFIEPGRHQALVTGIEKTIRNVDNPLSPRKGRIISFQAGVAAKGFFSDESFVRVYGRQREYFPVGRRDYVILRAELGAVFSQGGNASIPASLLFRAGGTDSVRGYPFQSIGNEQDGTVYPTRYLATGGIEYVHWIREQWGAAVFYDVGLATDSWEDRSLFHAVGVGARYQSPVGRINVDLAYGFQENKIRPHLSLGIAF
jgi:translocation and assembly module TamA